jgi:6-phosphogluconolactonase
MSDPGVATLHPGVVILEDAAAVAREAAVRFVALARQAVAERGAFHAALSGGKTPAQLFRVLAEDQFRAAVDWNRVHLYWSDERSVPADHPDCNYGLASRELLSRISVPAGNIHRMEADRADADAAAQQYEELLRRSLPADAKGFPRLDLIYLGMGADGHTASLFPGSVALGEMARAVVSQYVVPPAGGRTRRMTFTFPMLNAARAVVFLITGADKAETLRKILEEKNDPPFPTERVRPMAGERILLVDRAAAARLGSGRTAGAGDAP